MITLLMAGVYGVAGLSLYPGQAYSFYLGTTADNGLTGIRLLLYPFGALSRDTTQGFVDGRFFGVSAGGFLVQEISGLISVGANAQLGVFAGYEAVNQWDESSYHKVSSKFLAFVEPGVKPFVRLPSGRDGWALELWAGYTWPYGKQFGTGLLLGFPESPGPDH